MTRRSEPFSSGRTWALRIAAGITLFLLGILIGRLVSPSDALTTPEKAPSPLDLPSDGSPQDVAGAIESATEFARVMSGPSGDASSYMTAMTRLAAPEWRDRSEELAENAVTFVRERYGDGGHVEFYPIRYRVDSHSDDESRIAIWGVVLGSGPKTLGIEESWVTATLDLLWVDGEWKVSGQSSLGGPTPELLRVDEASGPTLDNFKDYGDAPGF